MHFSAKGSDCGIVNINIPTSGAEIGGAFGQLITLKIDYVSCTFLTTYSL